MFFITNLVCISIENSANLFNMFCQVNFHRSFFRIWETSADTEGGLQQKVWVKSLCCSGNFFPAGVVLGFWNVACSSSNKKSHDWDSNTHKNTDIFKLRKFSTTYNPPPRPKVKMCQVLFLFFILFRTIVYHNVTSQIFDSTNDNKSEGVTARHPQSLLFRPQGFSYFWLGPGWNWKGLQKTCCIH